MCTQRTMDSRTTETEKYTQIHRSPGRICSRRPVIKEASGIHHQYVPGRPQSAHRRFSGSLRSSLRICWCFALRSVFFSFVSAVFPRDGVAGCLNAKGAGVTEVAEDDAVSICWDDVEEVVTATFIWKSRPPRETDVVEWSLLPTAPAWERVRSCASNSRLRDSFGFIEGGRAVASVGRISGAI